MIFSVKFKFFNFIVINLSVLMTVRFNSLKTDITSSSFKLRTFKSEKEGGRVLSVEEGMESGNLTQATKQ